MHPQVGAISEATLTKGWLVAQNTDAASLFGWGVWVGFIGFGVCGRVVLARHSVWKELKTYSLALSHLYTPLLGQAGVCQGC